jgi:orotate phosphoribosyltransferase
MPAMNDKDLIARIAEVALLKGDFTLRSGRKSKYYLDKYLFETQPDILRALGERFAQRIDVNNVDRLAGPELGAIPLVTVAALATGKPTILVRNAKKDYGTAKQIEGVLKPGDRVVLIEDIATSGGQALEAAKTLTAAGAKIVKIIVVLDRQEGGREAIEAAGYKFEAVLTKTDLGINE